MYKQYPGKTIREIADMNAKNFNLKLTMFKSPEEMHKIIDLRPEGNRYVMQLKYKDRTTFLRIYDDNMVFPSETEVSAAFKRLLAAKLPKVAFLSGDLERNINKIGERDYKILTNMPSFRRSLVNQGFDVNTLSLDTGDIPADISTLVIADPKTALSDVSLAKIQQFIDKGGNLLIAGEPGKQSLLNPLLEKIGVQLLDGVLVQPSKELAPDLIQAELTPAVAGFYKGLAKSLEDGKKVTMPGATGLSYTSNSGYTVTPLLLTDGKQSWLKKGKLVVDSADIVYSPASGDEKMSVPTAISLSRHVNGKEQRIVVTSDADFISNGELKRYNVQNANFYFSTALFSWLSYGEFPIDTSRPDAKDNRVKVTSERVDMLRILLIWVLPGLLLIFGTILLIRRKRK
jgi:ABC-2 type transport system permease protein